MLADRKALVEKEIADTQKECADLYYQAAILGNTVVFDLYEQRTKKLCSLKVDLQSITYLIDSGREIT